VLDHRTMNFDPDTTAATDSGLFGLPFTAADSRLHIIPVPWEVTTSYGDGASRGPAAILRASHQVDLFDFETGAAYRHGFFLQPESPEVIEWNRDGKAKAKQILEAIESGTSGDPTVQAMQADVNRLSGRLNDWVYGAAKDILQSGRIAAVVGGDHSTPFGLIRALSEKHANDFGILHIDAHADLRVSYQGYRYSHASIMYNVMEEIAPQALVQVGIRDFSAGEFEYIKSRPQISTFFDSAVKRRLHRGENWQTIVGEILSQLPKKVYISFDIDGLDPQLCPNTGTPVPGGLSFSEALTLLASIVESGRQIVGFDLNEVAEPEGAGSDWDGNVGARLLYKLCGWTLLSNGYSPNENP
jgi:agmatinase